MSQYVADRSPYAYRLPPDTFLSRRDPGWYIGDSIGPMPAGLSDDAKRELLAAQASLALHDMANKITSVLNANFSDAKIIGTGVAAAVLLPVPGLGLGAALVLVTAKNAAQAKTFLTEARDNLIKIRGQQTSALEAAINVARDKSITYEQACSRISDFLKSYAETLDSQIKLNQSAAKIFGNAYNAFKEGLKTVVSEVLPPPPKDKDIPIWVWGVGGLTSLLAIAYIIGKVK